MPAMSTAVLSAGPVMVPPSRVPGVLCSKSKLIARDSTGLVKGLWFRSQPQKVVIQCQASAESHAVLHDFCMSIPFGGISMAAGVGCCLLSQASTGVPILSMGALIVMSSFMSLKAWKKQSSSSPYTLASAGLTAGIISVGWQSYKSASSKLAPMGLLALSGAMFLFLIYNMLAGGNPPPKNA